MNINTPKQETILTGVAAPIKLGEDSNIIITADDLPTLKGWLAKQGLVADADICFVAMRVGAMAELPPINSLQCSVAARDFAGVLNSMPMGELTPNQEAYAKQSGLVVVFGSNPYTAEVRGAIHDQAGLGEICLTMFGKILSQASIDALLSLLADGTIKKSPSYPFINHTFDGVRHHFETEIPHSEYSINLDGEEIDKGIVFHISDLKD